MNNDRLQYLLKCFHSNSCNEEELAELNEWFHTLNYSHQDFEAWVSEAGGKEKFVSELHRDFRTRLKNSKRTISLRQFYHAAAIFLLALSVGFILLYSGNRPRERSDVKRTAKTIIRPGGNKAILTLADGSEIVLDDASNGKLANQSGIIIQKAVDGQLVYIVPQVRNPGTSPSEYNTITTPRGGQYQVLLPDGSKVWLNAQSSLRFPVRFNDKERRIELHGEAYFEVAHNKSLPFRVFTSEQEVHVLGTHFNIKAYSDEAKVSTTLLEGRVKVNNLLSGRSKMLKPGEQSVTTKDEGMIDVSMVNTDEIIAWKSGYFVFDNQDIKSIMTVISRWYNVDIEYKSISKDERLGGTFSRSSDLQKVLTTLESIGKVHFTIEERKIIVSN